MNVICEADSEVYNFANMTNRRLPLDEFKRQFLENLRNIQQWARGSRRAPHKPLLLLVALARIQHEDEQFVSFADIDDPLANLLHVYGPPSKVSRPKTHEPFSRLTGDSLWELRTQSGCVIDSTVNFGRRQLINDGIVGGFPDEIFQLLVSDTQLVQNAIRFLLESNWPNSMHESILESIGIESESMEDSNELQTITRKPRDPNFRRIILTAYERTCAVCEFDLRLNDSLLDLQAAHIKWHAAGGPDSINNGIALCGFHHNAFDRGAIGLKPLGVSRIGYQVVVSNELSGSSPAKNWLLNFNGKEMRTPQSVDDLPDSEFVDWHTDQVFHGSARACK